jgi:hypothetical protein
MSQGFVSGHDFSPAESRPEKTWPLGPAANTENMIQFVNGLSNSGY